MQRACSRNCACHSRLLMADRLVADLERELAALQVGPRRQRGGSALGMRVPAYDYHTEWERYLRENGYTRARRDGPSGDSSSDSDDGEEEEDNSYNRFEDSSYPYADSEEEREAEYRFNHLQDYRARVRANRHRDW